MMINQTTSTSVLESDHQHDQEQHYIDRAIKMAQANNWPLTEDLLPKLLALVKYQDKLLQEQHLQ